MNMKNIFYCLLPGLLLGACSNKVYEKTGDSVIVKVQHKETGGPRLVRLQVMGDKLIRGIYFGTKTLEGEKKNTELIREAALQLSQYFDGRRKKFDLKLSYHGTEFQIKVWKALEKIPYGETCTYKDIAESVGIPKGCRAVGMANNRNPIVIVVPCHRVIGMNGSLTGYAGGLEMKEYLLDLEKRNQKLKERY